MLWNSAWQGKVIWAVGWFEVKCCACMHCWLKFVHWLIVIRKMLRIVILMNEQATGRVFRVTLAKSKCVDGAWVFTWEPHPTKQAQIHTELPTRKEKKDDGIIFEVASIDPWRSLGLFWNARHPHLFNPSETCLSILRAPGEGMQAWLGWGQRLLLPYAGIGNKVGDDSIVP